MAGLGSLCYLAGQVVSEADVSQGLQHNGKRPLEEALTALRKGALLLKHGRHGKPKVHFFRVGGCDTLLRWRSASGSVKQVRLRNVVEVVAGQTTEVFRRFPLREGACSFSLRYRDEDGTSRTLDLTAADQQQLELWFTGLRVIAARLAALGTPVGGASAQLAAASSGGLPACAPGSGGLSPADLLRCVGSRMQHSGGPVCLPASDRVPCDLLAWGSAQRAPPVAHSMRSVLGVTEDCWQHRSAPGLAPGGLQLDAYRAAVGRKHAAVITATGAVYTWGEGRSGKLGLGHDQDQAQPQRVRHCLEGQCVVAVACGDDCTAALTDGGELFMWGRPHVDSRLQLVPLQVRGELRGRKVVQVSCGPFHCAAVSSDGLLFTWGEGFGGKLGHGDQSNRTQPCQVAALAGRQVLEVACGVWHTAAIVCDPEGSPYAHSLPSTQQQQQHSPLKQEGSVAAAEGLAAEASSPAHLAGLPHHHRNNSTSSAFSESSVYHDGVGGVLYTWGGVNESVAFGASEKRDSNKGCLGHGEADLYRGQLLPVRVAGALEGKQVRHVAAGSHLTVAVTTGGRLFQMGATGASAPSAKHCSWEGATLPELVRGQLAGIFIEEVSCGMHHVVAMGRALDRKQGRPGDSALRMAFAWGRGTEGQLGVRGFDDSPAPVLVDGLKGRHVLQVACGGSNTMAVCEHDVRRWEPESKEEAEAASRLLNALASEPRQLRFQPPGEAEPAMQGSARSGMDGSHQPGEKANVGIVRRSFSMIASRSSITSGGGSGGGGGGGPPNLARLSSSSAQSVRSVGGASAAGSNRGIGFGGGSGGLAAHQQSFTQTYSFMASAAPPPHHRASMPHQLPPPPKLQRLRSDRTTSSVVSASEFNGSTGAQRIVSIGSPAKSAAHSHSGFHGGNGGGNHNARRSTYAGGGGPGLAMVSSRSFTHSLGAGGALSDFSSRSSWQHRPLSEDGGGGGGAEHEADSSGNLVGGANGLRVSSADLAAALDDVRSGSSSLALAEELAEKNRIIERLQLKLDKMQRHQAAAAAAPAPTRSGGGGGTAAEAAERLRESVRASAGAFRAAQQQGLSAAAAQQAQQAQQAAAGGGGGLSRPATASPGGSSQQLSLQRSSLSPSLLRSAGGVAGGGADDDQKAELAAMEALLAKKEAHLEGQQKQLADWAAELQRRETALAWQAAALAGAGGPRPATGGGGVRWAVPPASPASSGAPAVPEPIPSDSPVLAAGRGAGAAAGGGASPAAAVFAAAMAAAATAATAVSPAVPLAAVSPAVQQRVFSQDTASPGTSQLAPSSTGSGTQPESPALAADEWTEEFEKGVFLTFTTEGGAKKLRRIRFNRSLFSATSAKEWYEANKHQLSQTTGTPRVAGSAAAAPSTRVAASLGSTAIGASQPVTPVSASQPPQQEQQQQAQQRREQQQQDEQQQQAQQLQEQAGQAAPMAARAKAEVEAQAVAGLLHYRQTSRNLSFDARELATFNERLLQALAQQQGPLPQQQGQQPLGGGGSASLPLPQQQPQRPPSRLSRLPRPAAASGVAAPETGGSVLGSPLSADVLAAAAGAGAGASLRATAVTPVRQQVQAGEEDLCNSGGTSGGGGFASADAGTPAAASPLPPALGGEASREWKSAHSSPFPGDSPFPTSRAAAAATAAAADPIAVSAARSDSGSGSSSPIRAGGGTGSGGGGGGGGSRTSSPLSKTRSAASASLTRQLSGAKSDLAAKFTPRVAAEQQAGQVAAAAAAAARSQQQEEGGSETARSAGSASQATPSPEAAAKRPSSSPSGGGGGFSGKLSRIRRSLTGGGSTSKQK
ncbi:PH [Chlorella vulgaris]